MQVRTLVVGFSLVLLTGMTGCATVFHGGAKPMSFQSEPGGAEVLVNGVSMGRTPVTLRLKPNKDYAVTFRRQGYRDATVTLGRHVQAGWVVLDVVIGVVGVAVDAGTGKWKAFDDERTYVKLQPNG